MFSSPVNFATSQHSVRPNAIPSELGMSFNPKHICEVHPDEPLTNFCCTYDCLQLLCAECIKPHIRRTTADIESLRSVKSSCTRKLRAACDQLNVYLDELESKHLLIADDFLDEGLLSLRRARERLLSLVTRHFDALEKRYIERLAEFSTAGTDMHTLLEKIQNLMNELEHMQANLESANHLITLKKVCQLDLKTALDSLKREIAQLDKAQNIYSVDVTIDERREKFIEHELHKYAQLGLIVAHDEVQKALAPLAASKQSDDIVEANSRKNSLPDPRGEKFMSNGDNIAFTRSAVPPPALQERLLDIGNFQHEATRVTQEPKLQKQIEFTLSVRDYFNDTTQQKYLHYFRAAENILLYCDLQKLDRNSETTVWEVVQLPQQLSVPEFHKSLITPQGQIFVVGGKLQGNNRSAQTLLYDYRAHTLVAKQSLHIGRSSHAICYSNGFIYCIGGLIDGKTLTDGQTLTDTCERYDIANDVWTQIAPLKAPTVNCSACDFKGQMILKIGGFQNGLQPTTNIEKYDIKYGFWDIIDAKLDFDLNINGHWQFHLKNSCCAVQINDCEVFIFGGNDENQSSKQSLILAVENDERAQQIDYEIRHVNVKPLIHQGIFSSSNAIVHNSRIYALQSLATTETEKRIDSQQRLISFDGKNWRELRQNHNQ